ncbi:hypothetical protein [Faecalimicrobium dakarense]|uniref:hypothetical protein n=1 Tax=Faecalimicrobium dakarense TaxID=1301100 RepID=UPI0004B451D2|nr:hypothetical protein [[Clostridium] dakarense]
MRFIKDRRHRTIAIVLSIPILLIAQYYLFKFGIMRPMVKGVEVEIVDGDYIKDIDKFIIKLDETVTLSSGKYITIPSYSKKANIWFNILDESGTLKIEGNKLTGVKEGISSVAIMKNTRILKKADIKVVDPEVKTLKVDIDNDLKYVGDKATISSVIEVDYDKFKEREKVTYESMNEDVIKIKGNRIEAVGVGRANILVKAKGQEQVFKYNIKAKVDKIDIADVFEVKIGESKKLRPNVVTNPKGLKAPNIKFELVEPKLPIERAISLYADGTVTAIKEGSEKVRISCGNKSKIITVNVVKESITNNKIENLVSSYEIIDNKAVIYLEWDHLEGVHGYDVFVRNNSLQESGFKLYKSVKVNDEDINNHSKIKTTLEVNLVDGKVPNLSIYVIGNTDVGTTKPSNIVEIKPLQDNIQDLSVENLSYSIDYENNSARLTWDKINIENSSYSVYVKNNINNDGFILLQNGIQDNEFTMNLGDEDVNLDVYVVANQNDKYSKQSNIINIKK